MSSQLIPIFFSLITIIIAGAPSSMAIEFLLNSFDPNSNNTQITLTNDARFESSVVRFTNDSNPISLGRAFSPTRLSFLSLRRRNASSPASVTSFSTSFVFSILPEIATTPGFGICFFLSNWTSPPGALASQYFGLFSNSTTPSISPLIGVKFDTGRNPEFNDIDGNHIGINLNNIDSAASNPAGYFNDTSGEFVAVAMRSGENIRAWIDFDGESFTFNVTVAPAGIQRRPRRPTLSYTNPEIVEYLSDRMYFGLSASKTEWVEVQRLLAWSFTDTGGAPPEINTTGFPVFRNPTPPSTLSTAAIGGIAAGVTAAIAVLSFLGLWLLWRRSQRKRKDRDREGREEDGGEIEEWEMEFWPRRFDYEELYKATGGFSQANLLGSGGFGKVYRAGEDVAVKCINHDSKQGLREFMAEISSMGRLQHKNLVPMRGWCNRGGLLMLVYDYMPNGSLNRWIFSSAASPASVSQMLDWQRRRRVLADVAEGLAYLHGGYDQVVVHRDVKSSNILLDSDMRARLGDFGLAKLYGRNEVPTTTRVVGTLGYLAPELASQAAPSAASDVYSFGVVAMEVACGRRPIEMDAPEEEAVLVDWVRDLYAAGRVGSAADPKIREGFEEEIEGVLKLGLACCHPDPVKRPTMREVLEVLLGEGAAATPAEVLSALAACENKD